MEITTNKQLRGLLKEWQRRLRLEDWDITVEFKPDLDAHARTRIHNLKLAKIWISPLENIPDDAMGIKDIECSLVHELLHIPMVPIEIAAGNNKKTLNAGTEFHSEGFIDTLSRALVAAKRGVIRLAT